jgi:hypothetical protein
MTILNEFREDPMPPSRVDVPAAVRTGRRLQRARTGAVAVGAAAVLVAGAVAAPQVLSLLPGPGGGGNGQPAAGPAITCDAPAPPADERSATAAGQAPVGFDPLRRWVDASRVTGYQVENYTTARAWQRLELKTPSGDRTVEVSLYGKDGAPAFASEPGTEPVPVDPTTGTPAGTVNGAQAWWLPGRQSLYQFEVARLGWQWAPGAWAFVAAAGTSEDDPAKIAPTTASQREQLRAVAQAAARALRIRAGDAVRSPFSMPVPDCTSLISTTYFASTTADGEAFTRFTLTFGVPEAVSANPLPLPPDGRTVIVTADSAATPASKPGSAKAEVDGHRAYSDGNFLVVYGMDGFALEINSPGGEGAVREVFRTVHIARGATRAPDTWTDRPLEH